jgi:hypothetical protein
VLEKAFRIPGRDRVERPAHRFHQRALRLQEPAPCAGSLSSCRTPLLWGKGWGSRVAGTAARSPALREELPDARSLVSGEVVHHHVQSPSCPPVGCEPLLREALRQDHSRGRLPHPEEESWTTSEDRREIDEKARRLLEEDVKRRPAATVAQRGRFLEYITGTGISDSTIRRVLGRLGL